MISTVRITSSQVEAVYTKEKQIGHAVRVKGMAGRTSQTTLNQQTGFCLIGSK